MLCSTIAMRSASTSCAVPKPLESELKTKALKSLAIYAKWAQEMRVVCGFRCDSVYAVNLVGFLGVFG